jgi:putative DNA primase/helicase
MTKSEAILGCFLLNEQLKFSDFDIKKDFFKGQNERLLYNEIKRGNRDPAILFDHLKSKSSDIASFIAEVTDGLHKAGTSPERVHQLANDIKKERLQKDVLELINEGSKYGNFDHDQIQKIYQQIEKLEFDDDKISSVQANEIKLKAIKYDWPSRIPTNKFTLITGKPSRFKSGFLAYLASRYTTGDDWPDSENHIKGSVLFLSCEDDIEDTLGPRLKAAGCDMSKIIIITERLDLNSDIGKLEKMTRKISDLRVLFIDPINKYSGTLQLDKMESLNPLFLKLMDFAKIVPVTTIGVHHNRKDSTGDPMDSILGSRAWSASPRVVHTLEYDDDKETMLFLPLKNNLARHQKAISFKIQTKHLPETNDDVPFAADFELSDKKAEDVMNVDLEAEDNQNAFGECKSIILETLSEGRMAAGDFQESVTAAGVSLSVFQKTRAKLKNQGVIVSEKNMGAWFWDLKR